MALALNASEARWVEFIRANVVGRLAGSDRDRARTAAVVTWWALKEGILDLTNPLRHNLCGAGGDHPIGDLQTCPGGSAWQVGLSGIQPASVSLAQAEATARRLYPSESIETVLERTARSSGVDDSAADQIRNSSGDLRKSWLLRDGPISFTLQRPFVERCFAGNAPGWCFGTWDSARRFASDAGRIRSTVAELESMFSGAPTPGRSWRPLLLAAALGGAAYYLYSTSDGSRLRRQIERRVARFAT